MNVMNRKLFANRDARRKLANMGGIMVSSPELMQAAQTFQTGGPAVVKIKTVRIGDPLGGTNYDLYSDGSAVMLSTGRRIDPNNASAQPLLEMLQGLPDVSDTSDLPQPPVVEEPVLDSAPITENETGIRSSFPKIPDSRKAKDQLIRGKLADQIRSEGLPSITTPDDENPMVKLIEAGINKVTTPFKPDTTNNPPNPYQSDIDAAVESFTGPAIGGNLEGQDEGDSTLSGDNFILPPTEGYPFPTDAPEVVEEEKKKLEKDFGTETEDIPFSDIPGFTGDKEKDSKEELEDIKKKVDEENKKDGDPVAAASSGILNTAGVDTSNMGRKERVESMKAMLSDLLGYDDEDQKEEFWLTMASIGFGIAAGQDSNALSNIAKGLAEGASKLLENKATRQAREDKLTLTALGEVLADERAKTKFGYDMQIAAIRAAKSGVGTQEPFVDAVRVLAQKGLDSGMYETIEESLAAADAALRPYYTSTTATGDQAEETVQVVQDGQTITVKKSELPTQKKVLTKEG